MSRRSIVRTCSRIHAAWLIAHHKQPKAIQTRLGHSSIQVAIDRYGHLMDGLDHQTATRLDAITATVPGPQPSRALPLNAQKPPLSGGFTL